MPLKHYGFAMKKTLFALCTASMLFTSLPAQGAFFPAKKVVVGFAQAKEVSPLTMATLPAGETVPAIALAPARQQQRQGFWKRLKMRLLRSLLPDGENERQLIAFILGLTCGLFGVHRFYLGYNDQGLFYLLVTLSCALLLLTGASAALLAGPVVFYAFLKLALYIMLPLTIWLIVDLIRIAAGTLRPLK